MLLSNDLTSIHADSPIDSLNARKIESYFQRVQGDTEIVSLKLGIDSR